MAKKLSAASLTNGKVVARELARLEAEVERLAEANSRIEDLLTLMAQPVLLQVFTAWVFSLRARWLWWICSLQCFVTMTFLWFIHVNGGGRAFVRRRAILLANINHNQQQNEGACA